MRDYQLQPSAYSQVAHLYDGYDFDRCLLQSVLDQHQQGHVLCDGSTTPTSAALFHPGRYGYLTGDPENLLGWFLRGTEAAEIDLADQELFVPRNSTWIRHLYAAFGDRLKREGYEYFTFTESRIDWIRRWQERVPQGMRVQRMDAELARRAQEQKTLQVATGANWGSHERFVESGFGFVVLTGEDTLAGAISTFALGAGEAEIDITTATDFRRQGLATLMGCVFVAHCLAHDLTPSWTANYGNSGSTATARRLGFVDRFALPCFTIDASEESA